MKTPKKNLKHKNISSMKRIFPAILNFYKKKKQTQKNKYLEDERLNENGNYFEEATALALQIIETIISKEDAYRSEFLQPGNETNQVTYMHTLLCNQPIYIRSIAAFVRFSHNQIIPLSAIRVLSHVTKTTVSEKKKQNLK